MRRSCVYCGRIHPKGYICPLKPVRRKGRSNADRFRCTSAWQKKRAYIAARDRHLCRICLANGIYSHDIQVHHITPLAEDYDKRLDDDNLISLCPLHHEQAECGLISADLLRKLAVSEPFFHVLPQMLTDCEPRCPPPFGPPPGETF